jgi:hypothetical protein
MKNILLDDEVGIADYHFRYGDIMVTTLIVYLYACHKQNEDALAGVILLVQHGADISTVVHCGQTAMSIAGTLNMVEVVKYLVQQCK